MVSVNVSHDPARLFSVLDGVKDVGSQSTTVVNDDIVRIGSWNVDTVVGAPEWSRPFKAATTAEVCELRGLKLLVLQEVLPGAVKAFEKVFKDRPATASWLLKEKKTGTQGEAHLFAYDPNAVVLLDGPHVLGGSCVGKFKRPPVVAEFMIRETLRVFVCSVHLTPAGAAAKAKAHAQYEIKALFEAALPVLTAELGGRVRSCIFVGDFNLDPSDQEFNSLRHCGHAFQHLNDMASNCECLVEKGKILDNVWVSKQMLQLVARVWPNNRKAVTLDWDVAAFENWKTLQGYTGMATRLQQDVFKDFLLSQYLAKAGEEKKKQTPVKCFSHTGGASDHRPLLFALNCNRDAVTNAELSRAPGVN